ncbi:MAG: glutamate--tRNA ligase [Candidatus Magasanikbacteria bacterium]|nr:glutamate--tRNA ligase [Candidatus Magasanikbacteria bacterium]
MTVRTRFAPSPTGFLHVGGLRTALYAYLIAKQNGGKFALRIEDTDQKRTVEGGVDNIIRSLAWAGIVADEGAHIDEQGKIMQVGDKGPYIQSERLDIYSKYAQELLDKGFAYYCFCTPERLESVRDYQQKNKLPTGYDRHCRDLGSDEVKSKMDAGETHVLRMKMPTEGTTVFQDLVHGEVTFKNELVDDQVILKTDGFPTYHLAMVVDDHLMEFTHVIRGEEWLSSTPKHIQLFKYFGWEVPQIAHLPLLLNADKSKLSKRQGDVAVEDYAKKGYLPEAMINFVAFLGWNPGTEQELYSMEQLIKEFKFEKVNKSGSVFNLEKLDWYNQQYIRSLSCEELVKVSMPWLLEAGLVNENTDRNWLEKALCLEKDRITTLAQLPEALGFVFKLPDYDGQILVWKKSSLEEVKNILPKLTDYLNTISVQEWNKEKLQAMLGEWTVQNGFANGAVLWPLRVSLSGQQNSPGPFEIAEVLGKEETVKRINIALGKLK